MKKMKKGWFWLVILLFMTGMAPCTSAYQSGSYYPKATTPTYLYSISRAHMTDAEGAMIASLQGLLARNSATGIWIKPINPLHAEAYAIWLSYLNSQYGIMVDYTYESDPWGLLDHFKSILRGYILFKFGEESINVASSLSGIKDAIIIEESVESTVQSHDLSCLLDVRGKDETWCYDNYWNQGFRHDVYLEQEERWPVKLRDYAAMAKTFVFFGETPAWRGSFLGSLEEDSPGFGVWTGGEEPGVAGCSEKGVFFIPADHAYNLSVLSGIVENSLAQNTHVDPIMEENVHYVSFLMTDGDNLQWTLGGFHTDSRWFGSTLRGKFNIGWGIPPSMIDMAPSCMRWLYTNASDGTYKDYFVASTSGNGYFYPERYPSAELDLHVQRLNDYMGRADLSIVQINSHHSFYNTSLWDKYTAQPNIKALFYLEYERYNAHKSAIVWSNAKPVISAREMLWQGVPGCDEISVINHINSAPRDPHGANGYSLVMVHCWTKDLFNVQIVIRAFAPDVRVVTPEAFVKLITDNVEQGPSPMPTPE